MKSILVLLLSIPYVLSRRSETETETDTDGRTCIRGKARVDFTMDGDDPVPTEFTARGRPQECPNAEWGCGAVRTFGRSVRLVQEEDDTYRVADNAVARGYQSLTMNCVPPQVCSQIVGGDDGTGCRYADSSFRRYFPTRCNASLDNDASFFLQRARTYYACCNSDNCFQSDDSTQNLNETCTENEDLGNYITKLYACWATVRKAFRDYFICDDDGPDLVTFTNECRSATDGEYDRSTALASRGDAGERCRWRPTCSEPLQRLIETFGECACRAAESEGFTGAAIGSLIENEWSQWCPDIEISCAGENGGLFLKRRQRRRRIRFRVAKARSYFTEAVVAEMREKAAEKFRCQNREDIIEITPEDDTERRRLVDSTDSTIINLDLLVDDAFNEAIETDACDEAGLQATFDDSLEKISCEYTDVQEELFGTDASATESPTTTEESDSYAARVVCVFAVMVGLVAGFVQ